jgi:hypothetical protein
MIELLLPCKFDTLEYSWMNATIDICTLTDYSMAKKRQQSLGFQRSSSEHDVYMQNRGGGWLIVGVYVDDLIITGTSKEIITAFKV